MLTNLNDIYFDDKLIAHISQFSNNIYDNNGDHVGYIVNGDEVYIFGYILVINYFKKEVLKNDLVVGYISSNNDLCIDSFSLLKK